MRQAAVFEIVGAVRLRTFSLAPSMLLSVLSITGFRRVIYTAAMKTSPKQLNDEKRPQTRHLLPWLLLPLLAIAVLTGCKQEAKVAANEQGAATAAAVNPAGTYALESVDGKKVPCTVQHEGHTMTVNSGAFVIDPNGTCSSKISLAGRDSPIEVKASYTLEGSTLTMRWQGAGVTAGTVEGNSFTMNNEGMVFVYRK